MAQNVTVEPPPTEEAQKQEIEKKTRARETPAPRSEVVTVRHHDWLTEALLENSATRPKKAFWEWMVSLAVHTILLSVLILMPLVFTDAIDMRQFSTTFLVAPPPPPPPPPPAAPQVTKIARPAIKVFLQSGRLVAPTVIPEKVAMLKESDVAPDVSGGVVGGVPGGVPGGQAGGVLGGIITGAPKAWIPPAPATAPKAPIRVGGRVMAPRVISAPDPVYPPLARQARVYGDVVIDAVIDTSGNVVEMQVMSGHPLLVSAALDALKRWKYQPTILNEQPVPVQLLVTIRFRLQ